MERSDGKESLVIIFIVGEFVSPRKMSGHKPGSNQGKAQKAGGLIIPGNKAQGKVTDHLQKDARERISGIIQGMTKLQDNELVFLSNGG